MSKIWVSSSCYCTYSEESEERYGPWSEHYGYSVSGVYLEDPKNYSDAFLVNSLEGKIYVVYIIYSAGDSFGCSYGNGDIVWAFSNEELANNCQKLISDNRDSFSIDIEVEDGDGGTKTVTYGNPVAGYFEDLENCDIYVGNLGE